LNESNCNVGSSIKGDKIICRARKIGKPVVLPLSGRHKTQQIAIWENAFAVIEKKSRFLPKT